VSFRHVNSPVDLVKALEILQPGDHSAFRSIAELLGYGVGPEVRPPPPKPMVTLASRGLEKPVTGAADIKLPPMAAPPARKPIPSQLSYATESEQTAPGWLNTTPRLEAPRSAKLHSRPPLAPLLRTEWTRAILSSALSTLGFVGEIDLDRIIDRISRARAVSKIPRHWAPTLMRGVQLLIDCSESMEPFASDQTMLRESVQDVVGRDKTQILYFSGCPHWGAGQSAHGEWTYYEPPSFFRPVMVLTDLGIGGPENNLNRASAEDWREFISVLETQKIPLIAFVPYSNDRWPESLRQKITSVQWDRRTNVATIKRLLRMGSGIAGKRMP
jgi:hypothetical protein